jgi:hypothetical protein
MRDWLLSTAWYGSAVAVAVAAAATIRPMTVIGLSTRQRALASAAAAIAAIVIMAWAAPSERRTSRSDTVLDRVMPVYQFREAHARVIAASPERVRAAIKAVTSSDIALFRLLTAIRRLGRAGPENILNAPAETPILDVATRSGFIVLADTEREIAFGTFVIAPPALRRQTIRGDDEWFNGIGGPGLAKAAMNFVFEAEGPARTRLTTETRIFATDRDTARRFTAYWRTIFPGSWILRVTWLRAIAGRAEAPD